MDSCELAAAEFLIYLIFDLHLRLDNTYIYIEVEDVCVQKTLLVRITKQIVGERGQLEQAK